jgi:hypothetical protein
VEFSVFGKWYGMPDQSSVLICSARMVLLILRHYGLRGGERVLYEGKSEEEALAAFERAMVTLTQGKLTLDRIVDGRSQPIKRCDAVPLDKPRRPPRGGWSAGPPPTRDELKHIRQPSRKKIRLTSAAPFPTRRDK